MCSVAHRVAACRLRARMCLAVHDRHSGEQLQNNGSAWVMQLSEFAKAWLLPKLPMSPDRSVPPLAFVRRRLFVLTVQYYKEDLLNLCEVSFALPMPSTGCK